MPCFILVQWIPLKNCGLYSRWPWFKSQKIKHLECKTPTSSLVRNSHASAFYMPLHYRKKLKFNLFSPLNYSFSHANEYGIWDCDCLYVFLTAGTSVCNSTFPTRKPGLHKMHTVRICASCRRQGKAAFLFKICRSFHSKFLFLVGIWGFLVSRN